MGFIAAIITGTEIGSRIGSAIASLAKLSTETCIAVGTLSGAGIAAAVYCAEKDSKEVPDAYCYN